MQQKAAFFFDNGEDLREANGTYRIATLDRIQALRFCLFASKIWLLSRYQWSVRPREELVIPPYYIAKSIHFNSPPKILATDRDRTVACACEPSKFEVSGAESKASV
jgi:hypothetical protein